MLRRAVLLITGTATAVTGVLVYQPPKLSSVATSSKPPTDTTAPKQVPSQSASKSSNPNSTTKPTPTPTQSSKTTVVSGVFTGQTIQTAYGPVQVEITVTDGVITSSKALQFPNGDRRSLSISQQAIPYLNEQTLGVVSASQVQGVSRATFTSNGWRRSLESALSKAGV